MVQLQELAAFHLRISPATDASPSFTASPTPLTIGVATRGADPKECDDFACVPGDPMVIIESRRDAIANQE